MEWKDKISLLEAYSALMRFIDKQYEVTKCDLLQTYVADLQLLPDGKSADPALWEDWIDSIEEAKRGEIDIHLRLK